MKGMRQILVPVDFSECSKYAFGQAIEIAIDREGEINLIHVIDTEILNRMCAIGLNNRSDIVKKIENITKEAFGRLLKEFAKKRKGIKIRKFMTEGIPFLEILKKTKELDADLVVMGSFGTSSPLRRMFFGSTAEKVVRGLRVPVLCVPLPEAIEGEREV